VNPALPDGRPPEHDHALRFVARVAYDGTDYYGFQVQEGVDTIQGALEEALSSFTTLHGRVAGAGRTDSGVHARGQVVSGHVAWSHSPQALQRAWNAHLPPAIAVQRLVVEPPAAANGLPFHPRFSARSRTYRYTVVEQFATGQRRVGRSPLEGRFAHVEAGVLDVEAMAQAASHLLGTHDFATFGTAPVGESGTTAGESTVRVVTEASWQRVTSNLPMLVAESESQIVFTVTANAFLKRMVRRLVGTLLQVGRGQMSVDAFAEALAAQDRSRAAPPAFAGGLVLERVEYPPQWGLRLNE
jgi:tRNA pseudouridine38-40 synthase